MSGEALDISSNRRARKWTPTELMGRAIWELVRRPLFRWTPRPLWGWRRIVLRLFGARIGRNVHVYPTVLITIPWNLDIGDEASIGDRAVIYNLGHITIGAQVTISQGAHLCAGTHDYTRADMLLLKPPIEIGPAAWVCAEAFIGPGVCVGELAIVGARAVVTKNVPRRMIIVGNPARVLRERPSAVTTFQNDL